MGASLSTAGTACFLLPRATQTFYKQFRGSHLENTVCLSYLRFQEVLASLCGWEQLESGVLVCTWQQDELNLFSHLRRLQGITPAWMSLLDNKTNDWQNSGDTACVVAYVWGRNLVRQTTGGKSEFKGWRTWSLLSNGRRWGKYTKDQKDSSIAGLAILGKGACGTAVSETHEPAGILREEKNIGQGQLSEGTTWERVQRDLA